MSSDNVDSSDKPNASQPSPDQITAAIEADVAELNELLSRETLDEAGEASVEELLARLESADGVAKGVENKLDALLGNLDTLLASLEKNDDSVQTDSQQPSESKDEPAADNKDP